MWSNCRCYLRRDRNSILIVRIRLSSIPSGSGGVCIGGDTGERHKSLVRQWSALSSPSNLHDRYMFSLIRDDGIKVSVVQSYGLRVGKGVLVHAFEFSCLPESENLLLLKEQPKVY